MAFVSIDHRNGQNPDGSKGTLTEFEAVACAHCGACIAVLASNDGQHQVSSMDLLAGSTHHKRLGINYVHKRRCNECKGNICRRCEAVGFCSPLPEKIDHALKHGGQWLDVPWERKATLLTGEHSEPVSTTEKESG